MSEAQSMSTVPGSETLDADLDRAAEALARARRVSVLTGAGVSAESGVPTFRAQDGLWEKHRLEDVATADALARNPKLVWEFYEARRSSMRTVAPNAAHVALAEMESLFESFSLATQNVDGLHPRAGSRRVLEVHGSLWRAHCMDRCGRVVDPFFPFRRPRFHRVAAAGASSVRPSSSSERCFLTTSSQRPCTKRGKATWRSRSERRAWCGRRRGSRSRDWTLVRSASK